jgi:hypothetical protein
MLVPETVELNQMQDRIESVSCQNCKNKTDHKVLVSADVTQELDMEYWGTSYQVIQCLGCKRISFRVNRQDTALCQPSYEKIYPSPEKRSSIKDIDLLPKNVKIIYKETIKAINGYQAILSGIAIRTTLEAIIQEQNVPGDDLSQKINSLTRQGKVTQKYANILHDLRRIGNEAAHSIKPYSPEEIEIAMDVVEHLLQQFYILPHHTKENLSSPLKNKQNLL